MDYRLFSGCKKRFLNFLGPVVSMRKEIVFYLGVIYIGNVRREFGIHSASFLITMLRLLSSGSNGIFVHEHCEGSVVWLTVHQC
jgi:hypothetical protein